MRRLLTSSPILFLNSVFPCHQRSGTAYLQYIMVLSIGSCGDPVALDNLPIYYFEQTNDTPAGQLRADIKLKY